jgi:hypothetical protein
MDSDTKLCPAPVRGMVDAVRFWTTPHVAAEHGGMMNVTKIVTKTVGLGVGTLLASALASCPMVQVSLLGMLGALGALPALQHYRRALVLAIFGCGALAVYGVVRLSRGRRSAPGVVSDAQR